MTTSERGPALGGSPFRGTEMTGLEMITDGTSQTLMMSEILVLPELPNALAWGGPFSDFSTSLGGQVFTGWNPPNSPVGDEVARLVLPPDQYLANQIPPPRRLDPTKSQTFAARSHHPGGVVASRCDGSVSFLSETISTGGGLTALDDPERLRGYDLSEEEYGMGMMDMVKRQVRGL